MQNLIPLDFNKFIPYPEKFVELDRQAWEWDKQHEKDRAEKWSERPRDGFNQGGHEWCVANWNTKWNLDENTVCSESKSSLFYTFSTAWSPPLAVVKKMSEMFPSLEFTLKYWECGAAFKGIFKAKNGQILLNETSTYSGQRGG